MSKYELIVVGAFVSILLVFSAWQMAQAKKEFHMRSDQCKSAGLELVRLNGDFLCFDMSTRRVVDIKIVRVE